MNLPRNLRRAAVWAALGLAVVAAGYASVMAGVYARYGHPPPAKPDEADPVLDEFMPAYDVAERHHIRVNAPADVTLRAAQEVKLQDSAVVEAIFRAREFIAARLEPVIGPVRNRRW